MTQKKAGTSTIKESVNNADESSTVAGTSIGSGEKSTAQKSIMQTLFNLLGQGGSGAGGTGTGATNANVQGNGQIASFVSAAANEIGYQEEGDNNTKYGEWYGMNNQPWCAMFVSWCGNEAGVGDIVGKSALANAFIDMQGYSSQTSTPHAGDCIAWTKGNSKHVGIIANVEGEGENWSQITTIEGNSGDKVSVRNYTKGNVNNRGAAYFCTPPWTNAGDCKFTYSGETGTSEATQ